MTYISIIVFLGISLFVSAAFGIMTVVGFVGGEAGRTLLICFLITLAGASGLATSISLLHHRYHAEHLRDGKLEKTSARALLGRVTLEEDKIFKLEHFYGDKVELQMVDPALAHIPIWKDLKAVTYFNGALVRLTVAQKYSTIGQKLGTLPKGL